MRFLIIMGLLGGAIFGAVQGFDYVVNPWAHTWPGHQPLTGYWQGEIAYGPDDTRQIAFRLAKKTSEGSAGTQGSEIPLNITGEAKVCSAQGAVSYHLSGDTKDRLAERFILGFGAVEGSTLPPGQHPDVPEGTWDGEDRLQLSTGLYRQGTDGASSGQASADALAGSGDAPRSISFEMRRITGEAFTQACGGLQIPEAP